MGLLRIITKKLQFFKRVQGAFFWGIVDVVFRFFMKDVVKKGVFVKKISIKNKLTCNF